MRVGEGGDDHVELGATTSYADNPLHTQERAIESGAVIDRGDAGASNGSAGHPNSITTVSQHEHERVVEENEKLKAENSELKRKQSELDEKQSELDEKQRELETKRAHDREMQAVKAEKCQIEERASRAEAKLVEVEAKLERRTETGTL